MTVPTLDMPRLEGRVERWTPGETTSRAWYAIGGKDTLNLGDEVFRAEAMPAVVGVAKEARYVLLIGLSGPDLAFFGWGLQPDLCRPGLGEGMLEELETIALKTDRKGLATEISNADVLPFWFLQARGFRIVGMEPVAGGDSRGYAGIPKTHALRLRMEI